LVEHGTDLAVKKFRQIEARTGRNIALVVPVPSSNSAYNAHVATTLAHKLGAKIESEQLLRKGLVKFDREAYRKNKSGRLTAYPTPQSDDEILDALESDPNWKISKINKRYRKHLSGGYDVMPGAEETFEFYQMEGLIVVADDSIFSGATLIMCMQRVAETIMQAAAIRGEKINPAKMLCGYGLISDRTKV
jgi:hypothetical protein